MREQAGVVIDIKRAGYDLHRANRPRFMSYMNAHCTPHLCMGAGRVLVGNGLVRVWSGTRRVATLSPLPLPYPCLLMPLPSDATRRSSVSQTGQTDESQGLSWRQQQVDDLLHSLASVFPDSFQALVPVYNHQVSAIALSLDNEGVNAADTPASSTAVSVALPFALQRADQLLLLIDAAMNNVHLDLNTPQLQQLVLLRQSPMLLLLYCLSVFTESGPATAVAGRCHEQGGSGTGAT